LPRKTEKAVRKGRRLGTELKNPLEGGEGLWPKERIFCPGAGLNLTLEGDKEERERIDDFVKNTDYLGNYHLRETDPKAIANPGFLGGKTRV